ncbi:phage tail tube protein [Sinorhizobium medicae]|uniref:phage tail tube protein n=1 Tax=Sinorhizobium medicae TaxID=110321 RepID=UPI00036C31A8|nr:phage tail tube protein [Sinorhizobium medicae]MDX0410117.1 phage tail protein [Sinorhizobium medicae]MDX0422518.1 phage tail protein [Sinorhizobium medicae]MDX0471215.1 phage tail protein [Sinorhizobium medicae]MDX0665331.1 phage tail protein [Sinorhizobium medicae]MDX1127008.1 phage tail protein [Sinorhizobium medicae]
MVTAAAIGWSTTYEIWDASLTTPAFAFVAEVNSVTPGAAEVDRIDATHMQSPNRRREYIAGLIDNGEASFEMNFVPGSASDVLIRGLLDSGASVQHRITFPNGHRVTYNAVITGYEKEIPVDDKMTATVTVAVSGAETWDEAAP